MGNCLENCLKLFRKFNIHRISGKKLREIRHLAEGGYGYVSLVEDTETNQYYAMKKMICQTDQQRNMYKRQVSIMRELSNCPHVIGFYGSHQIQREGYLQAYILMELGDKTVFDLLLETQKKGSIQLSEMQILKILRDTCLGLQEMHDHGIMHQDVKVQNILLSKAGVAKLCDFGSCSKQKVNLGKIPKSHIYRHEERFQKNTTLIYRPPEMVDVYLKYPVDERVDIWMLGCVLFVMNYKYHPFQEEGKLSIVNAAIKYPKTISDKMQKLIRHMLTPNPYYRPNLQEIIKIIDCWKDEDFELNEVAKIIRSNQKLVENEEFDKIDKKEWHKMRPDQQIE